MKTRINVLLVDDSPFVISGLKEVLSDIENINTIDTAGTLSEATALMNQKEINTVILDINLPDGNGLNFLKWIKENHPRAVVMMLSNMADDFHRKVAEKRGADYFLDKSEDFQIIHRLLQKPDEGNA